MSEKQSIRSRLSVYGRFVDFDKAFSDFSQAAILANLAGNGDAKRAWPALFSFVFQSFQRDCFHRPGRTMRRKPAEPVARFSHGVRSAQLLAEYALQLTAALFQ